MRGALLIVDVQNDYFRGGSIELIGIEQTVANIKRVLEYYRKNNLPVIYVQHVSTGKEATYFIPNTEGVEINKAVEPRLSEHIVNKNYPNCFKSTNLHQKLKELNIKELTICGAMSHMCIDATVRAAFDLGYRCLVVDDACATKDLQYEGSTIPAKIVHNVFMAALKSVYAQVEKTNTVLERA